METPAIILQPEAEAKIAYLPIDTTYKSPVCGVKIWEVQLLLDAIGKIVNFMPMFEMCRLATMKGLLGAFLSVCDSMSYDIYVHKIEKSDSISLQYIFVNLEERLVAMINIFDKNLDQLGVTVPNIRLTKETGDAAKSIRNLNLCIGHHAVYKA